MHFNFCSSFLAVSHADVVNLSIQGNSYLIYRVL